MGVVYVTEPDTRSVPSILTAFPFLPALKLLVFNSTVDEVMLETLFASTLIEEMPVFTWMSRWATNTSLSRFLPAASVIPLGKMIGWLLVPRAEGL